MHVEITQLFIILKCLIIIKHFFNNN